jgi:hypothetical protein
MKLSYSDTDYCRTGRWVYEIIKKGDATGQTCGGRPVFTSIKTGEVYRKQIDAARRVAQLNAAAGGSDYQYIRGVQ